MQTQALPDSYVSYKEKQIANGEPYSTLEEWKYVEQLKSEWNNISELQQDGAEQTYNVCS